MNKFIQSFARWAGDLTVGDALWLCVPFWLAGILMLAGAAGPGIALYCFWLAVVVWRVRRHARSLLAALLMAGLLAMPMRAQNPQPQTATQCQAPVIIGGTVIVVGGIMIYNLWKMCKKLFPPEPPPDPPPTPGPTNAPPARNAQFIAQAQGRAEPASSDISGQGWLDRTIPADPVIFQDYCRLTLQASTDLTTWSNCCTVALWLSPHSLESVAYDQGGIPVATNWVPGNPYTSPLTVDIPFPLIDPRASVRYFRWQP